MIQPPKERGEFFEIDPYGSETRGRMHSGFDALIEKTSMIEDTELRDEQCYTGEFKLTQGNERAQSVPMIHRRQIRVATGDNRRIAVKDEDIKETSIANNLPEDTEIITFKSGKIALRFSRLIFAGNGIELQFIEKTFGRPSIEDLKGVSYNEVHNALTKEKENLDSRDTAIIRSVAHLLQSVQVPGENEILLPDLGIHPRTFNY